MATTSVATYRRSHLSPDGGSVTRAAVRRLAALHQHRNELVTAEFPFPRLRQLMGSITPGAPNSCQAQDERSSCYL
jgi:hypothetical protein